MESYENILYLGGKFVHGLLLKECLITGDTWYETWCGKDAGTARSRITTQHIDCPKCEVFL